MYFESEKMTIDKLPDEPIIVVAILEKFNFGNDMAEGNKPAFELLDSLDSPVFWIVDLRRANMRLGQLVTSSNIVTRGEEDKRALWHHPMIKETILVSTVGMIKLAAKGLSSDVFGNLSVKAFDTLDEALEYARSKIAA